MPKYTFLFVSLYEDNEYGEFESELDFVDKEVVPRWQW